MRILITGASSGIGEALARISAKRRFDLVLVARRKEKLDEIAQELKSEYDIDVEVLKADLTFDDDIEKVVKRVEKGDINILVNNAGFGSSGNFWELDIDNEINEIDLNVMSLVRLSHAALKEMVKKDSGTVVNVSSIAGFQPMTGNAVYGATKSFVTSFSHALNQELSETNVNVLVVCPGATDTEFFDRSNWKDVGARGPVPEFIWQSAQEVAEAIYIGIDKKKSIVVPGAINKVLAGISSSLPSGVTKKVTAVVAKARRTR